MFLANLRRYELVENLPLSSPSADPVLVEPRFPLCATAKAKATRGRGNDNKTETLFT